MRGRALAALLFLGLCPSLLSGQARSLVATSSTPVSLPTVPNEQVVLGSVSLHRQRTFTMFNVQAAGAITPDPELNGAEFQLLLLICDRPDCSGDIHSGATILHDSDSTAPTQVIATGSFGVSTHNRAPVVLGGYPNLSPEDPLYLAVALKRLHGPADIPFTGRLNLLRVDVMP